MTAADHRDRDDYERYGGTPTGRQPLDTHARRIGVKPHRDAAAQFQAELLGNFLDVLQAALADERVDPETSRRVLERVIYGACPNPAEADLRVRMVEDMAAQMARTPLGMSVADLDAISREDLMADMPFAGFTTSQVKRFVAQTNAISDDPAGFRATTASLQELIAQDLTENYLREFDKAIGMPPSTDEEYAVDAAKMRADIEAERELCKLPPLEQVIARGCDFPDPPVYQMGEDSYSCRCTICGRCGHHTGNSNQGHYWRLCKVTKTMREFHQCCPDDCELEAASVCAGVIHR